MMMSSLRHRWKRKEGFSEGDEVEGSAQKKRPQGTKEVPEEERPGI